MKKLKQCLININEINFSNKKSVSKNFASPFKFGIAIALFFVLMTILASAGDVIVQSGMLNVSNNLYVNSNGNVGIGTTNPGSRLEISNPNSIYQNAVTITQNNLFTPTLVVNGISNAQSAYLLNVQRGGNSMFVVDGVGNVGIGTTNPTARLYVAQTTSFSDAAIINSAGVNNPISLFRVQREGSDAFEVGNGFTYISPSYPLGIGTTTPAAGYKLDVVGKIHASDDICTDLNGGKCLSTGGGATLPAGTLGQTLRNDGTSWVASSLLNNTGADNIVVQKNNEVYLNLKNTEASGKQYALISAGSAGGIGVGKFSIYDKTAGVSRLSIDANGNVGIGTVNPGANLEVQSVTAGNNIARFTGIGGNYLMVNRDGLESYTSGNGANAIYFNYYSGGAVDFQNGKVRIDTTGNVGIGTTNPSYKLQVQTGAGLWTGVNADGSLTVNRDGAPPYIMFQGSGGGISQIYNPAEGTTGRAITFYTTADGGSQSEKVRITGSGNVGIGTTNPAEKLDVAGTVRSTRFLLNDGIETSDYILDASHMAELRIGGFIGMIINRAAAGVYFPNGNIGIGTTIPGQKLDVVGKIHASDDICTDLNGGKCLSTGGGASLPAGTASQTLRHDGTNWVATSNFQNDGSNLNTVRNGEVYLGLQNTETNGRQYALVSAGSAGGIGVGKFSIYDKTYNASRLSIDANGNVGIGTTNPGAKLEVAGDVRIGATNPVALSKSAAKTFDISPTNEGSAGHLVRVRLPGWSYDALVVETQGGSSIARFDNGGNSWIAANGGNVGIGTTSPSQKLEVAGIIKANRLYVPNNQDALAMMNAAGTNQLQGDIYIDSGDVVNIRNGGNLGVAVTTGGNVGIGTTSPISTQGRAIHVYNNLNDGTANSNSDIRVESANRNANLDLLAANTGLSQIFFSRQSSGNPGMVYYTHNTDTMTFRTAGADRLTIDSSGNVKITNGLVPYVLNGNSCPSGDTFVAQRTITATGGDCLSCNTGDHDWSFTDGAAETCSGQNNLCDPTCSCINPVTVTATKLVMCNP